MHKRLISNAEQFSQWKKEQQKDYVAYQQAENVEIDEYPCVLVWEWVSVAHTAKDWLHYEVVNLRDFITG